MYYYANLSIHRLRCDGVVYKPCKTQCLSLHKSHNLLMTLVTSPSLLHYTRVFHQVWTAQTSSQHDRVIWLHTFLSY